MKDIDFDELDRAVNSLMATTTPADSKTEDTPLQPVVTINSSVATPEVQSVAAPAASVEPVAVPAETSTAVPVTVRPAVPPAARRAGRFMDMVSTPSDTKPRPSALPVTAPSREGLTITPRPAESLEAPVAAVPSSSLESQAPQEEPAPVSFDTMPDPIDMHEELLTPVQSSEPAPEIEAEPAEEQSPNPPLGSAESPFLVDAKVEKRPLNSGSSEPMSQELAHELEGETHEAPYDNEDLQKDEKGADEPPVVPKVAELDSELLAIEANEKPELTQAVETTDAASMVEVPSTPLGASSIAQQYTTQPSSGDQSHAAIYDASQYPQPVAHPAKSKSGWLWVLWVAILLGVGAGGAILLYSLGIIP